MKRLFLSLVCVSLLAACGGDDDSKDGDSGLEDASGSAGRSNGFSNSHNDKGRGNNGSREDEDRRGAKGFELSPADFIWKFRYFIAGFAYVYEGFFCRFMNCILFCK